MLGPSRWTDLHKPTIAAVNGMAYAGGLEWACWTDMAVADEHATFGVTCRRWNIGLADPALVPLIVSYQQTREPIVEPALFTGVQGKRMSATILAQMFRRYAEAAGVTKHKRVTPHTLRSAARQR